MEVIHKYFSTLSDQQSLQFTQLNEIYTFWNEKINLISRKDIDNLYEHHVLHSLAIAKFAHFTAGTSVLDVGTGGGFPGIPLAILFPEVQFVLLDSITKKIKVVNEVIQSLQLKNVKTELNRIENFRQKFDFLVSRAVVSFEEFEKLTVKNIKREQKNTLPNGILYLKGGDVSREIKIYRKRLTVFNIYETFKEEYFREKVLLYLQV